MYSNKQIYISKYLRFFIVKENNNSYIIIQSLLNKKIIILKTISPINKLNPFGLVLENSLHSTNSLITKWVDSILKAKSNLIKLQGIGYRARVENNELILKIGHTFEINSLLPKNTFAFIPKRDRIVLLNKNPFNLMNYTEKLIKLRPINVYTNKGVRVKNMIARLKPGKNPN